MQEIYFIRHARSEYNVRSTKDLNSNLTEYGQKQAECVASFLVKKRGFHMQNLAIFTSPYKRCLLTSNAISEAIHIQNNYVLPELGEFLLANAHVSIDLKEEKIYPPGWDGDISKFKALITKESAPDMVLEFNHETNEVFHDRMIQALDIISTLNYDTNIVVSHGLAIATMVSIIQGNLNSMPLWSSQISNASITRIKFTKYGPKLIWNSKEIFTETEITPI